MGSCSTKKTQKKQQEVVVTAQVPQDKPRIERKQLNSQTITPILAKTNLSDTINESVISNRSINKGQDRLKNQIQIRPGLFKVYTLLGNKQDAFLENLEEKQIKIVQHNVSGIKKRLDTIDKQDTCAQDCIQKIQKSRLQNEYICPITNIYEDTENYYLLSDYCSGGSLSTLKGKLTDSQVMILLNQMVSAISYLHSKNMVHGKLSLDSFHLLSDLNSLFCKLVDVASLLYTNQHLQLEPSLQNFSQDVYALGVIGYQLLTGQLPPQINTNNLQENKEKVNENENELIQFNEGTSPSLKRILKKMLETKLNERITIEEAKQYLSKIEQRNFSQGVLIKPLYNLSRCKPRNYFHVVILTFMLNKFNQEEEQILQKIFNDADLDQDGLLKKDDILKLYKSIVEYESIHVDIQQLFQKLTITKKESIDVNEFISASLNLEDLLSQTYLETCFKYLQNSNGFITSTSVKRRLDINDKLFVQGIQEIKGQRKLNYSEFSELMRELK